MVIIEADIPTKENGVVKVKVSADTAPEAAEAVRLLVSVL